MVHDRHDAHDTHLQVFGSQNTHSINHGDTIITHDHLDAAVDGLVAFPQTMKRCLPTLTHYSLILAGLAKAYL